MQCTPMIFGISMASKTSRRWLVLCCYAVLLTLILLVFSSKSGAARYVLTMVMTFAASSIQCVVFYKLAKDMVLSLPLQEDFKPISLGLSHNMLPSTSKLDERQVAVRNAAYYKAYRIVAAYLLLMPIILIVLTTPLNKNLLGIYMLSIFFTIYTLPQAVILWTEPDVPVEAD